ncbi:hypothetical protein [Nonomuraea sp. NPDC050786]|uniref:hypothetical protein n=1 Tax=Nonomuraea sp. NPDC050786 TaxID=3154840 RepID=UPI0033FE0C34
MTATATEHETDPFSDPTSGSGLDAFLDQLVIIQPLRKQEKPSKRGNGNVLTVTAMITAVTGDNVGEPAQTTIYSNSLVPQIRDGVPAVEGGQGKLYIGWLRKVDFGRGKGWDLQKAEPADRQKGVAVLKAVKEREAAKAQEDPFA